MRIAPILVIFLLIPFVYAYSGIRDVRMTSDLSESKTTYIECEVTFTNKLKASYATQDSIYINAKDFWYLSVSDSEGSLEYEIHKDNLTKITVHFRRPIAYEEKAYYVIKSYTSGQIKKLAGFTYEHNLTFGTEGAATKSLKLLVKLPEGALYTGYHPEPIRKFTERRRHIFYYEITPLFNETNIWIQYSSEEKKLEELREIETQRKKKERMYELEERKKELNSRISSEMKRINELYTISSILEKEKVDVTSQVKLLEDAQKALESAESSIVEYELDKAEGYLSSAILLIDSVKSNLQHIKSDMERKALNSTQIYLKRANESLKSAEIKIRELNQSGFLWIRPELTEIYDTRRLSQFYLLRSNQALSNKEYFMAKAEAEKSMEYAYQTILLAEEELKRTKSRTFYSISALGLLIVGILAFSRVLSIQDAKKDKRIIENIFKTTNSIKSEYKELSKKYSNGLISKEEFINRMGEMERNISSLSKYIEKNFVRDYQAEEQTKKTHDYQAKPKDYSTYIDYFEGEKRDHDEALKKIVEFANLIEQDYIEFSKKYANGLIPKEEFDRRVKEFHKYLNYLNKFSDEFIEKGSVEEK